MEILRIAKNNKSIGSNSASLLISLLQIQFLSLIFFSNKSIPVYNSLFDWYSIKSESITFSIVIFHFTANLMTLGLLIIKLILLLKTKQIRNQTTQRSILFQFLQIKPYLLFVFLMNINIQCLKNENNWLRFFIVSNILFTIGELLLFQQVNVSFRFVEKNFIRRKKNSILSWMLIIISIISFHHFGEIYASMIVLVRTVIEVYFNFTNLQNQKIRKLSWFFSLLAFQFIVISFIHVYVWETFFNSTINFTFTLLFIVYCSDDLAQNLVLNVLKFQLKRFQKFLSNEKSQNQNSTSTSTSKTLISQKQSRQCLLVLRILVKIYFSRKSIQTQNENQIQQSDDFNNWWNYFDRLNFDHKYYCQNTTCICHQLRARISQNPKIQDKIFSNRIASFISNLKANSTAKDHEINILQNYHMIQIEKKPLKAYYLLIKLAGNLTITQQILQVENLISEMRLSFNEFFLKEKVQNHNLNIHQLLQFHEKMKQLKEKMVLLSLQYKKFYQLFSKNFLETEILKNKTEKLNELKKQFNKEIDVYLNKLHKNAELLGFSFIFYKYFDEYNKKFDDIIKKIQSLSQLSKKTNQKNKRCLIIDVFNPQYGAIKADLISRPGKIVSITSNVCDIFGYNQQQLIGQKINKFLPSLFAKNHDRYLRNFIQNGSLKILKCKQKSFLAKTSSKFITPISLRLKVDYLSSQNFFINSLIRRTPTKSQFILINNNGKIQQISEKLYNLLFRPSLREDIGKIKRLCVYKMLLNLNYLLKAGSGNDDKQYEGIILTSQNQYILKEYFKFPQLGIIYKNDQSSIQSSMNSTSKNTRSLSTLRSESSIPQLEPQTDTSQIDLKQSFKQYFKAIDFNNTRGFQISFKFNEYTTNQFKCKILEVLHIREQLTVPILKRQLSKQFIQLGQHFEFPEQQLKKFIDIKKEAQALQSINFKSLNSQQKDPILREDEIMQNSNLQKRSIRQITKHLLQNAGSEASSAIVGNQNQKRKSLIINAFKKEQFISKTFELVLIFLIFLMTVLLIIVCAFSVTLKSNYEVLQHDNIIITNFRVNFLLRLAIQQLQSLYQPFGQVPPSFLPEKKYVLNNKMKQLLKDSTSWINVATSEQYFKQISISQTDTKYIDSQPIISVLKNVYSTFLIDQQRGKYFADNYVEINSNLLELTTKQEQFIRDQSQFYLVKTHIIVALYAVILCALLFVFWYMKKVSYQQQDRIIDYLPFLNIKLTKIKVDQYEAFCQYLKDKQKINSDEILYVFNPDEDNDNQHKKDINNSQKHLISLFIKSDLKGSSQSSSSKFVKIVKNQKTSFKFTTVLIVLITIFLCLFVIFFSEYFFAQINTKFKAYLQLKNSAMLVQLIPSRIILLYFINTDKTFNKESLLVYPESFSTLVHDKTFSLQQDLSNPTFFGTEMEQLISKHFDTNICEMIECNNNSSKVIQNQQLFYLAYRYTNAFEYLRKIVSILPSQSDPKDILGKWLAESNVFEILKSIEYILQLMNSSQEQITNLFSQQINQIGYILLSLSLTLIPGLIVGMLFVRKVFVEYISNRIKVAEDIYKHFSWNILSQNAYAVNYFQGKLKKVKND